MWEFIAGAVVALAISEIYHHRASREGDRQLRKQQASFEAMMTKASDDLFEVTNALTHLQVFVLRALAPAAQLSVHVDDDNMPKYYQVRDDHGGMSAVVDEVVPKFVIRGRAGSGPIDQHHDRS